MSMYDSEIEKIEHELTVLGRQSVAKTKKLIELREERDRAFRQEMRILTAIKEDPGINFGLRSIMGEESRFRCNVCGRLLVGKELHGNTCHFCRDEDKA